jgi:O-acetyl-ADP-ribose deacetylase (regulator of RNase III)
MIDVVVGDLFVSKAQTLVNTVNCVGVMGKGIALEFKKKFPDMNQDYVQRCQAGQVRLGQPYLYRRLLPPWILNFPTKDHWRCVTKLEDIVSGLTYLKAHYAEWQITSLAVPPLGCGLGQLEWRIVGPTLYRYLKELPIPVELYAPFGTPHEELQPSFLFPLSTRKEVPTYEQTGEHAARVTPAAAALVAILGKLEEEPFHRPVGRVMFQKIAYFATEAGIPTRLVYEKGNYGPYSSELKATVTRLVNNSLIHEERVV